MFGYDQCPCKNLLPGLHTLLMFMLGMLSAKSSLFGTTILKIAARIEHCVLDVHTLISCKCIQGHAAGSRCGSGHRRLLGEAKMGERRTWYQPQRKKLEDLDKNIAVTGDF